MKRLQITFLFLLLGILTPAQEKAALYDSLFNTMHERNQFNGNVLVAENGNIVYESCFGYADREAKTELNKNTLFNTGSMSKLFTALAVQQLAERGELAYSDKVSKYLTEFPYQDVNLHHLLVHAGGLPGDKSLLDSVNWDYSKIATNEDVLKILYKEKPELKFTPGEKSRYSNLGYMVLAEVVKKVSGKDFNHYLQEHIFEPAGMDRTGIYDRKEIKEVQNVARGYLFYPFTGQYEQAIKVPEFAFHYAISGFEGDGNVYSTIADLFSLYKALKNHELISKASWEKATTKHILARNMNGVNEYGTSYGYGWIIAAAPEPELVVQRGGELPGYVSNMIWEVGDDHLLIYLMNDYLSYLSYQRMIYPAYWKIAYRNKIEIPKLLASTELSKIAVKSTLQEMEEKIQEIKSEPGKYEIDVNGLKFLVHKLKSLNKMDKARLLMKSFKPE
jgi:CubicO group peptidase (beta-lactamase class C family)